MRLDNIVLKIKTLREEKFLAQEQISKLALYLNLFFYKR